MTLAVGLQLQLAALQLQPATHHLLHLATSLSMHSGRLRTTPLPTMAIPIAVALRQLMHRVPITLVQPLQSLAILEH